MPTTSRVGQCSNPAISARILKEIVGYSHRGNKNKESGKEDNTTKIRLAIDLDTQIENMNLAEEYGHRTSDQSNNETSATPREQLLGRKKSKSRQNKHKIIEEFSPMQQSSDRKEYLSVMENMPMTKKFGFFDSHTDEVVQVSVPTEPIEKCKNQWKSDLLFDI